MVPLCLSPRATVRADGWPSFGRVRSPPPQAASRSNGARRQQSDFGEARTRNATTARGKRKAPPVRREEVELSAVTGSLAQGPWAGPGGMSPSAQVQNRALEI